MIGIGVRQNRIGFGGGVTPWENTYSLDFDGVDDYVDLNGTFNSIIQGANFTISMWFNSSTNTSYDCLLSNGPPCQIYVESNKIKIWMGYPYLTNLNPFESSATLSLSTWYHLAFVKSGSDWYLYLDGAEDNTVSDSGTVSASTDNLAIGIYPTTPTYPFQGNIDEVSIWNTALSSGDVSTLYNSGTPNNLNTALATTPVAYWRMGDSGTYFNGNWEIPEQTKIDNWSSHSMAFDGVDNHVRIGPAATSLGISGAITISMWCKMPAGATTVGPVILGEDSESGAPANLLRNWSFILVFDNLIFELFNAGGGASQQCVDPVNSRIQDGKWHHVMGTYSGTNDADGQKLYIDGVLVDSNTTTGEGTNTGAQSLFIGAAGATGTAYNWNGSIDDVAVFNTDKSGSIATIYNSGVPTDLSAESGLYGYWKMGEDATWDGSDWTIPDASTNSNDGTSSGMAEEDKINNAPDNINQGLSSGMGETAPSGRSTDVP